MRRFSYFRPENLQDAVAALRMHEDARALAGGMSLIPMMKHRLTSPGHVVDLGRLEELNAISMEGNELAVGAMATHWTVSNSSVVKDALPALSDLAGSIGDPMVRHRGTIGGSIANADPSADYPAAVLALNATIVTDRREIPADNFFRGLFETALASDEIIVRLRFPIPRRAAYAKMHQQASRFAFIGIFVADTESGARVAVTGATNTVFRATNFEKALTADFSSQSLDGLQAEAADIFSDIHAQAEYRKHLITVLTKRAVVATK